MQQQLQAHACTAMGRTHLQGANYFISTALLLLMCMLAARVRTVRVQAVAATVNNKTVLAPPYNVLITGSTKGEHHALHPCDAVMD